MEETAPMRCPEETANPLSYIFFSWISPLLKLGSKRPLEHTDLFALPSSLQASHVTGKFQSLWRTELADAAASEASEGDGNGYRPSLPRTLFRCVGVARVILILTMSVLQACAPFAGPLLLRAIIRFLADPNEPEWHGIVYAILLAVVPWVGTVIETNTDRLLVGVGMGNMVATNNAVYRKALSISQGARQGASTGEIVQLMSTDAMRMFSASYAAREMVSTPIQIVIALVLLWEQLGPYVLAGLVVIVLFIPYNSKIGSALSSLYVKKMFIADERVKLMNEILAGIRVIKYHAYETSFTARVEAIRERELSVIAKIARATAALMFGIMLSPTLIFLGAIITYAAFENSLTVERVFVSMALFNLLRMPLSNAPMMAIQLVMALTSVRRLEGFLMRKDASQTRIPYHADGDGVTADDLVYFSHGAPDEDARGPKVLPDPLGADASGTPVLARIVNGTFSWANELTAAELASMEAKRPKAEEAVAKAQAKVDALAGDDSAKPKVVAAAQGKLTAAQTALDKVTPKADPGPALVDINLSLPQGSMVAVVGPVGSGKSSLVSALLGEIHIVSGAVCMVNSVAFVPQSAWIMNATLRDNILYGLPFDQAKYDDAVTAAALTHDLSVLPAGDMTEIGERGINLSGGQKQRVSIARAVYADAEIYVLDDPLSAVDSEVGKAIFDNCINGALAQKTRLITTNHLHHLPSADYILVLANGGVIQEEGTFDELLAADGAFADMYRSHMGHGDDAVEGEEGGGKGGEKGKKGKKSMSLTHSALGLGAALGLGGASTPEASMSLASMLFGETSSVLPEEEGGDGGVGVGVGGGGGGGGGDEETGAGAGAADGKLTVVEERDKGSVSLKVYWQYLAVMGTVVFFATYITLHVFAQALTNGTDLWLSYWSSGWLERKTGKTYTLEFYLGVLVGLAVAQTLFVLAREMWWVRGAVSGARSLHDRLLGSVLASPLAFFDTTPLGRILNRFSKDTDTVDTQLPSQLNTYVLIFFLLMGMIVAICIIRWYYTMFLIPVGVLYYFIQRYFRMTALELRRLSSIARSPIYQHFSETLTGVDSVRAYSRGDQMVAENCLRLDHSGQGQLYERVLSLWLRIRLATLGQFLVLAASLSIVLSRDEIYEGKLDPGLAILAVSYSLSITRFLQYMVMVGTEVELHMNSVERVTAYASLPSEAPARIPETAPGPEWPPRGDIELSKVSMRYRPGLPLVIKSLTASIKGGERIGVVGRSGSGKSSLMSILFRLQEIEDDGGAIKVDGVDVGTIGLADLRDHMAIIPQDPVLFAGTVRNNVDPFDEYREDDVWQALELAMLKPAIVALEKGLDEPVTEGGSNFSVGERQLLCLARALLRKPKILVCDEASAAIDFDTDAAIQMTLRSAFVGATQLVIAHRINTIIDADRIMVLDDGKLAEFDTPAALLENPDGAFTRLVEATGSASAAQLRSMANANVSYMELVQSALKMASTNGEGSSQMTMDDLLAIASSHPRARASDRESAFAGIDVNVVDEGEYEYYGSSSYGGGRGQDDEEEEGGYSEYVSSEL